MTKKTLNTEIVRAVEAGINAHLKKSFKYSPFKLFFNMFKRANPKLIDQARTRVATDVEKTLATIENFNSESFVKGIKISNRGVALLQICYNIGIDLLKNKLTVITAFRAVTNYQMRNQIYNYLLEEIREATIYVLINKIE